jgi:hypothetical protein
MIVLARASAVSLIVPPSLLFCQQPTAVSSSQSQTEALDSAAFPIYIAVYVAGQYWNGNAWQACYWDDALDEPRTREATGVLGV